MREIGREISALIYSNLGWVFAGAIIFVFVFALYRDNTKNVSTYAIVSSKGFSAYYLCGDDFGNEIRFDVFGVVPTADPIDLLWSIHRLECEYSDLKYRVTFEDRTLQRGSSECEMDRDDWLGYSVGQTVNVQWRGWSDRDFCSSFN